MPFADEAVIRKLEQNLSNVTSVTGLLEKGYTPEAILETLLEGMEIEYNDRISTRFYCNCCKERVAKALISVGRKELKEMIDEGKEVELNCHFCNSNYVFDVEELKELYELSK